MALKSLNQLRFVRTAIIACRNRWLQLRYGIALGSRVTVSLSARFAPGRRGDIVVGEETLIAFKTLLYTRVPSTGECLPIRIGRRCFVGGGSVILPGVTIGDESIVAGGSVVFDDVPARCIVGGNPARVLRRDIEVGPWGRLNGAQENTDRVYFGIVT